MRRRDFLATATALAAAGVAGCTGRADDGPGGGDPDGDTPTGTGGSPTPDDPITEDPPGSDCPSFVDDADRTVCYRDRGSAPVFLRPESHEFQDHEDNGEVETLTLTLHNEGEVPFRLNPYDWAVYRRSDGGWVRVSPDEHVDPLYEVSPGGTFRWVLSSDSHPSPTADDATNVVVPGLVSGDRHAFRVHGSPGETGEAPHVECVATFDYVRSTP